MGAHQLVASFGTAGVIVAVFAESGLPVGFVLPGKSLLLTAGLLASRGTLSLWALLAGTLVAALVGEQVGYSLGRAMGPGLWERPDGRFLRRAHLERAQTYFDRRGASTVVLARFLPVMRTFTPIVAGVARMRIGLFIVCNTIGAVLYASGFLLLGYFLGRAVPGFDRWLVPAIIVIALAALVPSAVQQRRGRARGALRP
jgi:membrane-associated protein